MRVLLDECVPAPLRRELSEHEVQTVPELGWSGKTNGELLALMEREGITALITVDQRFANQVSLASTSIILIVVIALANTFEYLRPHMPAVRDALAKAAAGTVIRIGD